MRFPYKTQSTFPCFSAKALTALLHAILFGLLTFPSVLHAEDHWVGYMNEADQLVMANPSSGASHIPAETPRPLQEFRVSKDGNYAVVLAQGTHLTQNVLVKSHHGPQLYLYDRQEETWTLLSKDPSSQTPLGARSPLLISGDGELIYFETGPVFPRVGSLSESLRGYFGPVCYDRIQDTFRPVGAYPVEEAINPQTTTTVSRHLDASGKAMLISNDSALGADPEGAFSFIMHNSRMETYTPYGLSNDGSTLPGYNFYKTEVAGFTPAELLDPEISGPTADPDGDGIINHTEYLLNTPPLSPSRLPFQFRRTAAGGLEMIFPLSTSAQSGDLDLLVTHSLLLSSGAIDANLAEDWQGQSGDGSVTWKRYPIDLSMENSIFFRFRDNSPE
ncbi:hypothetical protein P0Y35_14040 [Kiritimatiellaeota bacterium B1221]|nr:hypothetical protein [Kiritimatiellaeota bacterium B1221]